MSEKTDPTRAPYFRAPRCEDGDMVTEMLLQLGDGTGRIFTAGQAAAFYRMRDVLAQIEDECDPEDTTASDFVRRIGRLAAYGTAAIPETEPAPTWTPPSSDYLNETPLGQQYGDGFDDGIGIDPEGEPV